MSLTFLGWLLIVTSIVIPALLVFSRSEQLPLDIGARLKPRKLNEAESRAARPALLSRLRLSRWGSGQDLRGAAGTLIAAAAVFLLFAGVGAATWYVSDTPDTTGSGGTSDGEMLSRLEDYTRSIEAEGPASKAPAGKLLPDVNTMIERLEARLKSTPEDVQGWRMLGWSYFNMERYDQAAAAYGKAVELDPSSSQLKLSYEEAKVKASESDNPEIASASQTEAVSTEGDGPSVEKITETEATPPHQADVAIRSMVDGLADRLESSPRDVEGWTRLMRSRVVLGERERAATAFRAALDVFKDDSAASVQITAAAIELGLKAE